MCWRWASSRVLSGSGRCGGGGRGQECARDIERGCGQDGSAGEFLKFGDGDAKFFSWREQDGAFDEIFEFADVARPGVVDQRLHDRRGNVRDGFVLAAAEFLDEIADQERNVFRALAEGREMNGKDVEAVDRDRCGIFFRRRAGRGRSWWRRRRGHRREWCDCRRGVRIPAPGGRGAIWAGARAGDRRLRRGRSCRRRRIRSGRFFGRPRR